MTEVPAHQLDILRRMSVPVVAEPRSPAAVLALDNPSGLDLTAGRVGSPCILADATLTLALPKRGLRAAPDLVGELFAADIAVPPWIYERIGVGMVTPFAEAPIVRVDRYQQR